MKLLIAVASEHGATLGIAERIAQRLSAEGHDAACRSVSEIRDLAPYDAFVVGSAVYLGRWRKEALEFVHTNRDELRGRPTWLFSSGPLGAEPTDEQGRDKLETSVPEDLAELQDATAARDHVVFFGALDPHGLPIIPKIMRLLPAGRRLLPEGDFRDWAAIDAWAEAIARDLAATSVHA